MSSGSLGMSLTTTTSFELSLDDLQALEQRHMNKEFILDFNGKFLVDEGDDTGEERIIFGFGDVCPLALTEGVHECKAFSTKKWKCQSACSLELAYNYLAHHAFTSTNHHPCQDKDKEWAFNSALACAIETHQETKNDRVWVRGESKKAEERQKREANKARSRSEPKKSGSDRDSKQKRRDAEDQRRERDHWRRRDDDTATEGCHPKFGGNGRLTPRSPTRPPVRGRDREGRSEFVSGRASQRHRPQMEHRPQERRPHQDHHQHRPQERRPEIVEAEHDRSDSVGDPLGGVSDVLVRVPELGAVVPMGRMPRFAQIPVSELQGLHQLFENVARTQKRNIDALTFAARAIDDDRIIVSEARDEIARIIMRTGRGS